MNINKEIFLYNLNFLKEIKLFNKVISEDISNQLSIYFNGEDIDYSYDSFITDCDYMDYVPKLNNKKEYIDLFKDLHMENWNESYLTNQYSDYLWGVDLSFTNGSEIKKFRGDKNGPCNLKKLFTRLNIIKF